MSAKEIVGLLSARGQTVAVAESLTGGLLGARICDAPGASKCFLGGVIAYQDEIKARLLSVSPATLSRFSAVSAACAREMARGAQRALGSDYALSATGYAGPTGEKVGLVYIGLCAGKQCRAFRLRLGGSRQGIREMTTQIALYLLQKEIEKHGEENG